MFGLHFTLPVRFSVPPAPFIQLYSQFKGSNCGLLSPPSLIPVFAHCAPARQPIYSLPSRRWLGASHPSHRVAYHDPLSKLTLYHQRNPERRIPRNACWRILAVSHLFQVKCPFHFLISCASFVQSSCHDTIRLRSCASLVAAHASLPRVVSAYTRHQIISRLALALSRLGRAAQLLCLATDDAFLLSPNAGHLLPNETLSTGSRPTATSPTARVKDISDLSAQTNCTSYPAVDRAPTIASTRPFTRAVSHEVGATRPVERRGIVGQSLLQAPCRMFALPKIKLSFPSLTDKHASLRNHLFYSTGGRTRISRDALVSNRSPQIARTHALHSSSARMFRQHSGDHPIGLRYETDCRSMLRIVRLSQVPDE